MNAADFSHRFNNINATEFSDVSDAIHLICNNLADNLLAITDLIELDAEVRVGTIYSAIDQVRDIAAIVSVFQQQEKKTSPENERLQKQILDLMRVH